MSSELRKSMESLQLLLERHPSPVAATSLAARMQRASEDGQSRRVAVPEDESGRGGSLDRGLQRSSTVSFQFAAACSGPSGRGTGGDRGATALSPRLSIGSSLAAITDNSRSSGSRDSGSSGVLHTRSPLSDRRSPVGENRDSLSYTPFDQEEAGAMAWKQHQQLYRAAAFQNNVDSSAATETAGNIGSPHSAFSAVSKLPAALGNSFEVLGSAPFGTSGETPGGESATSGTLGSVSSAVRTGGPSTLTAASSSSRNQGCGGLDMSAGKQSTASSDHYSHTHGPRRETSLLVSPVPACPQSEVGGSAAANSVFGRQATGGQADDSPQGTETATSPEYSARSGNVSDVSASARSANVSGAHYGPTGTPLVSSVGANAKAPARYGPTGTPFASVARDGPAASANSASSAGASVHHGLTGTPHAASSTNSTGDKMTPATAGLKIHTNLPPSNGSHASGRDPTPYGDRSYDRSDPTDLISPPYYAQGKSGSHGKDSKKSDVSSSRSGLDPPAKSPFPTTIKTTSGGNTPTVHSGSGYNSGFAATGKSAHSHHYHKDHHPHPHAHHHHLRPEEPNELSMIVEDESLLVTEDDRSLVSNVISTTLVRTPIGRKLHGGQTPKKKSGGHHSGGARSTSSNSHGQHQGGSHTPRSHALQFQTTPGSTASTVVCATPSNAQLLHRPSLAMRESLTQLATATSHALEEIWDCVGVPPDDRATQLVELVDQFQGICQMKVASEEGVRDQFRESIEAARREWKDLCKALRLDGNDGEDPVARIRRDPSARDLDDSVGGGGGTTLQWEYEAILGRLESLRGAREAAVEDMLASRSTIHEAYAALHGCTLEESSSAVELQAFNDVEADLTIERREAFRARADEYGESLESRTRAVVSLLLDCQSCIRELEIIPGSAEGMVGRFEDDAKILTSLEPVREGHVDSDGGRGEPHLARGKSSNYTVVSKFETPTCIGIADSALNRLTSRVAELNGEKQRRRARLGEMGGAIAALWKLLRVPREEQREFTSSIHGLGMDTIRKGEAELVRLDDLKGLMIGKLVREQRSVILDLWEKTNSSPAERASFDAYFCIKDDELLTPEVLDRHKEYVDVLGARLEKMQPILDSIAKREAIIEERMELEFLQKDPSRLTGRGSAKQLAKEEKMRRRVMKELPRITCNLERALNHWYEENRSIEEDGQASPHPDLGHFMYRGSPYLYTIQRQEEEWLTRKERGEHERQRKRDEEREERVANAAFGYTAFGKPLPGKKRNPPANGSGAAAGARPHSATSQRSLSNTRSGSNMRSGTSHPASAASSNRSGSNIRFGGRGPLGDVSSSRQNALRPPSRPKGGRAGGAGTGMDRGKKVAAGVRRGYRPASAPRMRM